MKTFRKTFRKSFIKNKLLGKASAKAQSAMEYLMTYGWAILIISVVLAALFQLGVFNPMTFAPKAPPGACQVFRPNGPYTTSFINLEGMCSGELPQYVATITPPANNGFYAAKTPYSVLGNNYTIYAWFNIVTFSGSGCNNCGAIADIYNASVNGGIGGNQNYDFGGIWVFPNQVGLWVGWPYSWEWGCTASITITPGIWYNVAATVTNYNSIIVYVNGKQLGGPCVGSPVMANVIAGSTNLVFGIGDNPPGGDEVASASIADVQLYNTTLSANEIQALYLEGIGGAPIRLQNLVGWWPLNGNANDYSGNGNNEKINGGVNFVSNWYNGYTPP